MAAGALPRRTPRAVRTLYDAWWRFADQHFVDREAARGGTSSPDLVPSATTWRGKPDVYHAFNARRRATRPR
jgi:hypothetical protein